MVKITKADRRARAYRAGVREGDYLLSLNSHEIHDVLDYRFYLAEKRIELSLLSGGETKTVVIEKEEYDDIGLTFETPLMDEKHSCRNKCIFCFIDQLPKGMRETLYFKDDDSRLSFLHGNYITLTNLSAEDVERIIKMRISLVNISVHTTNPELRVMMMKNKNAGRVLSYLDDFKRAGLTMHGQIVLCRGVNDGAELLRTMSDLEKYVPELESVSIVPVGLTDYREGLYPLTLFSPAECAEVIDTVNEEGERCKKFFGTRIFYAADELYTKSGMEIPPPEYYENYAQLENGVGLIASMREELFEEMGDLTEEINTFNAKNIKRRISVATGTAAFGEICGLVEKIKALCYNIECTVYRIENDFFGHNVTVAGLLTGTDMVKQLSGNDLGEELLFSHSCLRAGGDDVFLDDMTLPQLSHALGGIKLRPVYNTGSDFLKAVLGVN